MSYLLYVYICPKETEHLQSIGSHSLSAMTLQIQTIHLENLRWNEVQKTQKLYYTGLSNNKNVLDVTRHGLPVSKTTTYVSTHQ